MTPEEVLGELGDALDAWAEFWVRLLDEYEAVLGGEDGQAHDAG